MSEIKGMFNGNGHYAEVWQQTHAPVLILDDPDKGVLPTTLHDEAWRLLTKRPDKEWSLVDCSSMVIMARRGIAEAFTSDHHFEQGGFVRSLK